MCCWNLTLRDKSFPLDTIPGGRGGGGISCIVFDCFEYHTVRFSLLYFDNVDLLPVSRRAFSLGLEVPQKDLRLCGSGFEFSLSGCLCLGLRLSDLFRVASKCLSCGRNNRLSCSFLIQSARSFAEAFVHCSLSVECFFLCCEESIGKDVTERIKVVLPTKVEVMT